MQSLPQTTESDDIELNGDIVHCARELLDGVPPVIWCMRRAMRSHRKGLSMPQFRALVQVHQRPRIRLSDIADNLGSSLPTTSRLISGLVDHGLIDRVGCTQDRRQIILRITPRGEEVLREAWDAATTSLTKVLAGTTAAQRQAIVAGVAVLKENFGAVGIKAFGEDVATDSSAKQNGSAKQEASTVSTD